MQLEAETPKKLEKRSPINNKQKSDVISSRKKKDEAPKKKEIDIKNTAEVKIICIVCIGWV